MTTPGYPAARAVAARIQSHFSRHLKESQEPQKIAPHPDEGVIESIVDAAFWASLRREEGIPPTISLAYLPPSLAGHPITFERPVHLVPEALTKLAPAVARPGIHLGVWHHEGVLCIWGATLTLPAFCFVIEVIEPGLLVIKHRREQELTKFVNVAVLEGDQVKVLDHQAAHLSDSPALVASLLGFDSPGISGDATNVLIQLAVSMREHKRGGSLLVVPNDKEHWRESIVGVTPYAVAPSYAKLAALIQLDDPQKEQPRWQDALRRVVDVVAGLTAVDGAMVLNRRFELLAFGAKIGRREAFPRIENVIETEPVEGNIARTVTPSQLGGTRHLSAAQFAQDQPDALALVASQDGRFTIFAWSAVEQMVHAYRVEALLL